MRYSRLIPSLFAAALAVCAPATQANPHETTLANGLRVIVKEDRRAPTAVHMVWYRAGGMDAPVLLDVGLEAMEAKFTTNGARREAMKFFGLSDQGAFNGTFRGSFKTQKGGSVPVVATVRGLLKEINPGDWKAGDLAACTYSVAVSYYKLEVEGREMFEIDPANSVRKIDGVDQLAAMRNDLGV